MIIAVDGACLGNGKNAQTSAFGVYLNQDKAQNYAFKINEKDGYPYTNQRAELYGALAGLRIARRFAIHGGQVDCSNHLEHDPEPCHIKHAVIKSDSAYLVNSMTK